MNKIFLCLPLAAALLVGCNGTKMEQSQALKVEDFDLSADLTEDFDQYANGGWKVNNPMPEDKSRYGTFDQLRDNNEKQVRELIEGIAAEEHESGTLADKIAKMYQTGMDTASIEAAGIHPLQVDFKQINALQSTEDLLAQIAYFHKNGISSAFALFGSADKKNSSMVITHLYQDGLGLPDKDYYLSDNDRFVKIREAYLIHLAKMFVLFGEDEATAEAHAATVFAFEKQLAEASMDRLTLRDPLKTYNKMTTAELAKLSPAMDWTGYFSAIGLGDPGDVIVGQPDFITCVNTMLTEVPLADWKVYFRWNLMNTNASYLTQAIVDQNFDFYGKTMSGTPSIRPRWKRVVGTTNSVLSEAVGQLYVEQYFPPEAKERMLNLVNNLRLALGERIAALDWMEDETKENAQVKLDAMNVKIGYPDKWKDYTALDIQNDAYVQNVMRARQFAFNEMLGKINKPVDKTEWHMPPQMVNAYYSPLQNEIVFPAGILQPPFFYMHGDDAVNYGAIGMVIGHEMTHGFDDRGRLYGPDGNLNTWWTEEDGKRFEERSKVLVDQFNEFIVLDSTHANGEYTLGENIADLGGLNIAFTAFKKTEQYAKQDKIDSFTPNQRFYLAYAHLWAQNLRDEEILRLTQVDVHSLGKFRIIGPLRNIADFHEAFQVPEGAYMRLPEAEQAFIW